MSELIIAFRSRTDTMRFSEILTASNITNLIINTPRSLSLGCGISIKVNAQYINYVRSFLCLPNSPATLIGVYKTEKLGNRSVYSQIQI